MLAARVCSRQVNECCMHAHNSLGHSSATGPMADRRLEPSDVPTATVPASQLNVLHSWYRTSMCVLRPLSLKIEADQRARKADTYGTNRQSKETLCLRVCSRVQIGRKNNCPMNRDPCQGKQTNKLRAEFEERGSARDIKREVRYDLLKLQDTGPLPGPYHDNTLRAPQSMTASLSLSNRASARRNRRAKQKATPPVIVRRRDISAHLLASDGGSG